LPRRGPLQPLDPQLGSQLSNPIHRDALAGIPAHLGMVVAVIVMMLIGVGYLGLRTHHEVHPVDLHSQNRSTTAAGSELAEPAGKITQQRPDANHVSDQDLGSSSALATTGAPVEPTTVNLQNEPDTHVCELALSALHTGWQSNPSFSSWVGEAQRRRLTIEHCRMVLGIRPSTVPTTSSPTARTAKGLAPVFSDSDLSVCRMALNRNRTGWELIDQPYSTWAKEAIRRHISEAFCIKLVNDRDPLP
jgi:hypothetical protein